MSFSEQLLNEFSFLALVRLSPSFSSMHSLRWLMHRENGVRLFPLSFYDTNEQSRIYQKMEGNWNHGSINLPGKVCSFTRKYLIHCNVRVRVSLFSLYTDIWHPLWSLIRDINRFLHGKLARQTSCEMMLIVDKLKLRASRGPNQIPLDLCRVPYCSNLTD